MSAAGEEQLRLVTSFDELAADMRVVDMFCDRCKRAFCTSRLVKHGVWPMNGQRFWDVTPDCNPTDPRPFGITEFTVQCHRVYRIVDEPDQDARRYATELEGVEILARAGVRSRRRTPATTRVSFLPGRRP